eukprot:XP_011663994.1 PREDICTED: myosin-9-like [Strongylocentrotus purpuratus]
MEKAKKQLKKLGITDIYDVPPLGGNRFDEKPLQSLLLLHGCLKQGDEWISADLIQLYSFPRFEWLLKQGRKDVTEAQKRHREDIREEEEAKKLLRGRITDLEQELNESRASRASIVSEKERLQGTMKVERERHEHSERAVMENEKRAKQMMETYKHREMEYEKKLQSKDLRIETMAEHLQGIEEKARRQVDRLETDNEEMMTKFEEKERNETTLRQQVEELKKAREGDKENRSIELSWKKEHDFKEGLLEQLKREAWKLRTKIQLESEIRSAEQKKKAETHQWSFIPWGWGASGKQAQSGTSSFEDNSTGGLGSDTIQEGDCNTTTECVVEEQIDAEYDKEDVNDEQLSARDETSLKEDQTKGHTDTQVLQEATASNDHTPRDGHTGDMASKTQDDLTDGSRSQHPDKSPESSRQNLDASEVTSEDMSTEEIHAGDDMTNVSSIQPADQSSSHDMQVLPEDLSEIAPLVSSGGKPDEESTILEEEDLISQLVLIDPFPEKIMLLFLLKIIMDVPQTAFSL